MKGGKCPICGNKIPYNATSWRTCGRPCYILYGARCTVKYLRKKLEKAEDKLERIEEAYKEGKLTNTRHSVNEMLRRANKT